MTALSQQYLSTSQAAEILRMHPFAIQKLIYQGRLPAEKVAYRWLIPRKALEDFAKTYIPKRGRPRQKMPSTKKWNSE